jgi:hypothetical protein
MLFLSEGHASANSSTPTCLPGWRSFYLDNLAHATLKIELNTNHKRISGGFLLM